MNQNFKSSDKHIRKIEVFCVEDWNVFSNALSAGTVNAFDWVRAAMKRHILTSVVTEITSTLMQICKQLLYFLSFVFNPHKASFSSTENCAVKNPDLLWWWWSGDPFERLAVLYYLGDNFVSTIRHTWHINSIFQTQSALMWTWPETEGKGKQEDWGVACWQSSKFLVGIMWTLWILWQQHKQTRHVHQLTDECGRVKLFLVMISKNPLPENEILNPSAPLQSAYLLLSCCSYTRGLKLPARGPDPAHETIV